MNIKENWKVILLPIGGGILFPMSFPMKTLPHFMPFSIIGVILLFCSLPIYRDREKLKDYIYPILIYSLFYNFIAYYWIPSTLTEFGGIPFPLNQLLGILYSQIIVPQYYICFGLLYFLKKKGLIKKYLGDSPYFTILLALFITLVEIIVPQIFPTHLGHPWKSLAPFLGTAPTFGIYGYSFISYWLALSFVSYFQTKKFDYSAILFFSFFLLLNLATPLEKLKKGPETRISRLRIVQPNIGNFLKISSEKGKGSSIIEVRRVYIKRSIGRPVDLIVFPETSYPRVVDSTLMRKKNLLTPALIGAIVIETKSPIFWGGFDKSYVKNQIKGYRDKYNATFLTNKERFLSTVYHKQILLPMGEWLPFGPFNASFSKFINGVTFFAAGEKYSLFKLDNGLRFISPICYEILFSPYIRRYLNTVEEQPGAIINVANDSWFGYTSELWQHQLAAFWRAIEYQLPVVRATNTGITSILNIDGSESHRFPLFKEAVKEVNLLTSKEPQATFFQRFGIFSLGFLFALSLGFSFVINKLFKGTH